MVEESCNKENRRLGGRRGRMWGKVIMRCAAAAAAMLNRRVVRCGCGGLRWREVTVTRHWEREDNGSDSKVSRGCVF